MATMRVSDYIALRLAELGVRQGFIVTGGGAMHLNDAFGRAAGIEMIPMHHEQGCAMAAEAYARVSGRPALLNVTTGPGGVNAINGVFGAWTDSIPMLVVSGQVKRETLVRSYDLPLRQLGDQEIDITRMVSGVVKMARVLDDPKAVRRVIEEAHHVAVTGRPGPVWVDVPIDVQASLIDPETLEPFVPADEVGPGLAGEALQAVTTDLIGRLLRAERPVILVGTGVRVSGAYEAFRALIERLGAPVVTAWNAHDVLEDEHPLYAGRPGTIGNRGGNFAVQNADLVVVLGCRLNIRQISYNFASFAPRATKVMVDVDPAELAKPTLSIDVPICADLAAFVPALHAAADAAGYVAPAAHGAHLAWARERLTRYPVVLDAYRADPSPVNPYVLIEALFDQLEPGDIVACGDGTACVVTFQAARLQEGQRLFTNSGSASMGYDLPAAIGAYYAGGAERTGRIICLAGDGSLMMNIQELAVVAGRRLPIKLIILNNDGYHSIRQTQQNFFPDNVVGCGPDSGLAFPDFLRVAEAFGIPGRRCGAHAGLAEAISETLAGEGPQVLEVLLDKRQQFAPKLSSRRLEDGSMVTSPLEDMAPFLNRDELAENMILT